MFTSYRIVKLAAVLSVLGFGVAGISGAAQALDQIAGTPHDLRTVENGGPLKSDGITPRRSNGPLGDDTNTDMCVYCHTPHMDANADAVAPLWNRAITTGQTFVMYDSSTMDMTVAAEPQGVSLACLSCHDGVTGIDSAVQQSGKQGSGVLSPTDENVPAVMTGRHAFGPDLSDQHPISVSYDNSAAGDENFQPIATPKAAGLVFYGAGEDQVECGSCHNPHDSDTVSGRFLRMTNANSTLCLSCHIK